MVAEISYIRCEFKNMRLIFKLSEVLILCCSILINHAMLLSHHGDCKVYHILAFMGT